MATRRITPSFVAGSIGGAVLACLVTWGAAAWSLSHDQQKLAQAFVLTNRCTLGTNAFVTADLALSYVEAVDRGEVQAARESALQTAQQAMLTVAFHWEERSGMADTLEARLERALGLPYDESTTPLDGR